MRTWIVILNAYAIITCNHSFGMVMLLPVFIVLQGFLPNELQIIGYARSNMTNEDLYKKIRG